MTTKIAVGLERAFAARGFSEPSVEDLREAASVSLRTLYKYAPSRDAMVHMALEHRHRRYINHVFGDPKYQAAQPIETTLDRIANWMKTEASHGCLFHAAVACAPDDQELRRLLERHKSEVCSLAVAISDETVIETDLMIIIEGLTQAWPLCKDAALASAKRLARLAASSPI
ncbi:TetR/AcrR family transcriptional regulator [Tritonibacter mobilis]|uniref:TetR/AcrR family transcriptional regulator n=1 Tax=Tritonibacter mobilis TaxID=379347 RepID=UPI000B31BDC1|nr:TetR/AcrR family transcriptional regulator [Tritonibacter mobilis]